jgi:hypothetical protein
MLNRRGRMTGFAPALQEPCGSQQALPLNSAEALHRLSAGDCAGRPGAPALAGVEGGRAGGRGRPPPFTPRPAGVERRCPFSDVRPGFRLAWSIFDKKEV